MTVSIGSRHETPTAFARVERICGSRIAPRITASERSRSVHCCYPCPDATPNLASSRVGEAINYSPVINCKTPSGLHMRSVVHTNFAFETYPRRSDRTPKSTLFVSSMRATYLRTARRIMAERGRPL